MRKFRLYLDKDKETAWLNEMSAQGWTKSLKNVKKKKCTLKDLVYGEKTENHRK